MERFYRMVVTILGPVFSLVLTLRNASLRVRRVWTDCLLSAIRSGTTSNDILGREPTTDEERSSTARPTVTLKDSF